MLTAFPLSVFSLWTILLYSVKLQILIKAVVFLILQFFSFSKGFDIFKEYNIIIKYFRKRNISLVFL